VYIRSTNERFDRPSAYCYSLKSPNCQYVCRRAGSGPILAPIVCMSRIEYAISLTNGTIELTFGFLLYLFCHILHNVGPELSASLCRFFA
jgi:hypothetical protein